MRHCYIVVRYVSKVSNGVRQPDVEDNPVRMVFTTHIAAEEYASCLIRSYLAKLKGFFHFEEERPGAGILYRAKVVDAVGKCIRSYSVIKEVMVV